MKTAFRKSFTKDLKKHRKNKNLLTLIKNTIQEVEDADGIISIKNLKKLKTERALHRSEIYRYFP